MVNIDNLCVRARVCVYMLLCEYKYFMLNIGI